MDAATIRSALERHLPELAGDGAYLVDCRVRRLLLKGDRGQWSGTYEVRLLDGGAGPERVVRLRGTLWPPHLGARGPEPPASARFGDAGWRATLPELNLDLETEPPEQALPAWADLTDPERASVLLERTLREAGPRFGGLRLRRCTPRVLGYKPGSRCVVECGMDYGTGGARPGWPDRVIAKTYRKDKGRTAYEGMSALWSSSLARSAVVTIAEPLAYVPEVHLLVQSAVPGDRSLEQALAHALIFGGRDWFSGIEESVAMTARGLADLHLSDASFPASAPVDRWLADIRSLIDRLMLAAPLPGLDADLRPVLEQLESIANTVPPGDPVPSHGTFDPEQVLIHQAGISLIDFDDYCGAEPAMDVGLFLAAIPDLALTAGIREGRDASGWKELLDRARRVRDAFTDRYAALAPISPRRVVLWQALDLVRDALHTWVKAKPAGPGKDLAILRDFLEHAEL
jgi:hypothetical protein